MTNDQNQNTPGQNEATSSVPQAFGMNPKQRRNLIVAGVAVLIVVIALFVRSSGSDSPSNNGAAPQSTNAPASTQPSGADDPVAKLNEAVSLINAGNFDEGIKILDVVIALDPGRAIAYYNLGVAYQFSGRLEEADANYTKALVIDNTIANAYYNRGLTRRDLGRLEDAAADLRVASALSPNSAGTLYNLGNILISLGQEEEGNKILAQAKALDQTTTTAAGTGS